MILPEKQETEQHPGPESSAANYQRVRLWSGITSIGSHLAVVWLLFGGSWLLPAASLTALGLSATVAILVALAFFITLASLPFDILVGHAAENLRHKHHQPFRSWLLDWLCGAGAAAFGLACGLSMLAVLDTLSSAFVVTILLLVVVIFLAASLLGPLRLAPRSWILPATERSRSIERQVNEQLSAWKLPAIRLRVFDSQDSQINGWLEPVASPLLAVSQATILQLPARQIALLAAREWWLRRNGLSLASRLIAPLWLGVGLLFATTLVPAQHPLQAALGGAAVVTSWCFLALFIWPHLNRRWMVAADRSLLHVTTISEVTNLLAKLQQANATDIDLRPEKESIFHPIPSLTSRLNQINTTSPASP